MAKLDASPLLHTRAKFVSVEKLLANGDKNSSAVDKYLVTFIPQKTLINGRGIIGSEVAEPLGINIRMKLAVDVWQKVAPLLSNKIGEFFDLDLSPEPYAIDGKSGVWYRFYSLEPI